MNIINTVNSKRFSLNGIEYLKNYVTGVHGTRIEVFNCYERKDVLIPLTAYNQFNVNGVVYGNVAQTQAALADVLYARATLGTAQPDIDQDNIDIVKRLKVTTLEVAGIINKINALPDYIVGDKQSLWFVINVIPQPVATPPVIGGIGNAGSSLLDGAVYKYKMINYGKGIYGAGGTQLTTSDIELVYVSLPTPQDVADEPSTAIINFGSIEGQSVNQWLNLHMPAISIQPQDDGYTLFKGHFDGEEKTYLWTGTSGLYGSGHLQSAPGSFQLLDQDMAGPFIPTYSQTLAQDNNTTIYAIHKDDESTATTAYGSTIKHIGTEGKEVNVVFDEPDDDVVYSIPAKQADDVFAMKSDINGLTITANQAAQELYLRNSAGDTLATLSVAFLNNEGTTFYFNEQFNSLELKNDAGEVLSTIPISNFIANVVNSAAFSSQDATTLEFKDSEGNVVFGLTITINNISGLQDILDNKVPYLGAMQALDLGNNYVTSNWVIAWNKIIPTGTDTKQIFGVYIGESGLKSLYVYVDSSGRQHVGNRGGNSSSTSNTAFGVNALTNNAGNTGVVNTAFGNNVLTNVTSGHRNTVFGGYSGTNISTGAFNTLIGSHVSPTITISDRNTIVGQGGANCLTTGRKNTLIGRSVAGGDVDNGNYNGLSTGSSNVIITHGWGTEEGANVVGVTSGSYNTLIGYVYGLQGADSNRVIVADGQANRALEANMLTKEIKIAGKTPVLAPFVDVADSTVLTGSVTETVLKSYLIAANDISAGILDLSSIFEFSGTAGIKTLRIYKNTTNSLTGATLIATNSLVAASTYTVFNRPFVVKPNNILYGYNAYFASAEITTSASGSLALSAVFYPTVNNYLIITAQLGSASDSITQKSFALTYRRAT